MFRNIILTGIMIGLWAAVATVWLTPATVTAYEGHEHGTDDIYNFDRAVRDAVDGECYVSDEYVYC